MKLNPFAMMNREPNGRGMIFDPENNKALTLNASGVVVWEALDAGLDESQILQRLVEEFEVTPEEARRDLQLFISALKSKGLLSDN